MRKNLLFISFLWLSFFAFSQTPQAIIYQTVARNNAGEILASQNISFRMSILQGALPGTVVYSETHSATTNASGLATLEIGRGTPVSGNFATINWSTTPIFLKTEIDPAGGSAYFEMGTSELLSVPFAQYAENTANNDDADADPSNELQTLSKDGQTVTLSNSGGSFTDEVNDADSNPANELQTLSQNGLEVSLSQGGGTINIADSDNNPSNEIQQLNKNGNVVTLSQNGGSFTDEVNDADADPINELQTITETDYQVILSQGGGSIMGGIKSLTQTEIDAMTPYNGLTLHNSTTNCINYYYLNNWFESCGICTPQPTIPNAGPDQIGVSGNSTTLAANSPMIGTGFWTIVSGEGGIISDESNPSSTFTGVDGGNYLLAWTTSNRCGSISDTVHIYFWDCGFPFNINHLVNNGVAPVDKLVTYGTVTNIPGEATKCWITSNLGAGQQATAVNDQTENSAGWYWQFNKKQGYKHDGITRTPNIEWIGGVNENSDWTAANDPCALELGNGWRMPTYTEWSNVDATGNWSTWADPWNSGIKLHMAGFLEFFNGSLSSRGSSGTFWSGQQADIFQGFYLDINAGICQMYLNYKDYGFSLRCLKD